MVTAGTLLDEPARSSVLLRGAPPVELRGAGARRQTRPRVVFYVFLLLVGVAGAMAYVFLFMTHVPGAKEERLGEYEPLPDDLGKWVEEPSPTDGGWVRERRYLWSESSGFGGGQLVLQVRYRDPETREIVRVDPEQTVSRKRVRRR